MIMSRRVALAVGGVAVAGVVGTAGIAAAAGAPGEATPLGGVVAAAPSASGSAPGATDRRAGDRERSGRLVGLGQRLHGESVVKTKTGQTLTLVMVNGTVTAASATSVTVKAEDGFTATYSINSETVVTGKGGAIKTGQRARVVGTKTQGGLVARAVATRGN
jgi:hypothetical protein